MLTAREDPRKISVLYLMQQEVWSLTVRLRLRLSMLPLHLYLIVRSVILRVLNSLLYKVLTGTWTSPVIQVKNPPCDPG